MFPAGQLCTFRGIVEEERIVVCESVEVQTFGDFSQIVVVFHLGFAFRYLSSGLAHGEQIVGKEQFEYCIPDGGQGIIGIVSVGIIPFFGDAHGLPQIYPGIGIIIDSVCQFLHDYIDPFRIHILHSTVRLEFT